MDNPPALGFPGAGFLCPPSPPTCPPLSLYSPVASRRLCAVLRPAGGIFAPVASRAGERPKHKTAVKAICRPVTAFYTLVAIPIFPRPQTGHSGPQNAPQGINQPRPAPSQSKPGLCHLFRAMDSTAQRSLSASHQAQRGPSHCPPMYSTRGGSPSARHLITPAFSVAARSGAGSRFQKASTGGLVAFSGHSFPRVRSS